MLIFKCKGVNSINILVQFRSIVFELIITLKFDYVVIVCQHRVLVWYLIGLKHTILFNFYNNSMNKVLLSLSQLFEPGNSPRSQSP